MEVGDVGKLTPNKTKKKIGPNGEKIQKTNKREGGITTISARGKSEKRNDRNSRTK